MRIPSSDCRKGQRVRIDGHSAASTPTYLLLDSDLVQEPPSIVGTGGFFISGHHEN